MTDSTTDIPKPHGPKILSPHEVRSMRRAISNVQAQIVEAARARVPNIALAAEVPAIVARRKLKEARREFGRRANPFLNRATRRSLAREVGLA